MTNETDQLFADSQGPNRNQQAAIRVLKISRSTPIASQP